MRRRPGPVQLDVRFASPWPVARRVRYSVETGESVVLHTLPWLPLALALSPDGSRLAVSPGADRPSAFAILDTSYPGSIEGFARPAREWGRVVSLTWTPEGDGVVFTAQQEWLELHNVWWGELESGEATVLDYTGPGVVRPGPWSGNPRFSAAGDQLLLIAGSPAFDVIAISLGG